MIRNDIINPILNDFLTTVTGYGGPFFKSSAISRLNDFTDYLSELTYPNFEFAFYPLRRDQNVGIGKTGFGIGVLASGTPIVFPKNPNWNVDGMILGPLNNAGEVDFSGKFQNDFQFRKDECSIFYFLQHSRKSFPTTFYRDNTEKIPYFCFDLSYDHFSVVSPNFSKSRFRGRGTTYIYDEIYGEDQKGLQIDWSQKASEKYYLPQSYSFYQMDKEVPSGQYICINGNFSFNNYSLRTLYGKDYRILSGNFLAPYGVGIVGEDPNDISANQYFFSRRMVIGAGVSNKGYQYDVAGMDHICPGFLILKGNYSHKAEEIASRMAQCIGIVNDSFILYSGIDENSTPKDFSSISASLTGMKYVVSEPKILTPIRNSSSFSARIKSIFLKFIGIVTFTKYPWGWWGTTSLEQTELKNEITGVPYNTGVLNYNYPILGSEYNQITGFVSGYLHPNGERLIFQSDNISGQSGFYYPDSNGEIKKIIFPPYKVYEQEKITGFISGNYDIFGKFTPLNNDIFVSGYYLENQKFYLNPITGILNKDIIGFISGTIDRNGNFSGFDDSNIKQSSGYINDGALIQFPPYRYVSGTEPVIGYIKGVLNNDVFFPFAEVTYLYDSFGNITGSILSADSDISGYFYKDEKIPFPTGNGFSGFDNMPYFYSDLGYEFSGLFVQSSGLLFDSISSTGYMTGFIGSKASIKSFGIFDGLNNVDGFQNVISYSFTGFFVDKTGFSGIDPEWQLFDTETQIGILTGRIGSYDYIGTLGGNINFDGKSGFNPLSGYGYSGFFVESSGFKSLDNQEYGFGEMTGIIGYRIISEKILSFNGFSGIQEIDSPYYGNVFVNFANATGFSGINNQSFGLGIFTGIISSGNLTGEVSKLFISTGISTYSGYDFNVTGLLYSSGVISYENALVSGEIYEISFDANITGITSYSGLYNVIDSGNISFSPGISGITYRNAIVETGISGMSGISGPNQSGDTASISCTISSFELIEAEPFELYPYLRAVSGLTYLTPKIASINYYEDMPAFGSGEASRIVGRVTGIRYFTFSNELTFADSGISYAAAPINLSTGVPETFSDICEYRPIPFLLTGVFPTILQPPSVTEISDIDGLTNDPYFDNVVLLLNMSGENLSRNILDSSKYHHKIVASIGAGQFDDLISYRSSGLVGIYLPWTIESGNYSASGLSGENNIKIVSETCNFVGSGTYLNSDVTISNETIGLFGCSGTYINLDVTISNETIGLFGCSGVILITGVF